MFNRTRFIVAVLWALSLLVVGRWATAQGTPPGDPMLLQQYVVYTGNDIGFRVYDPLSAHGPAGRLVVRMSGQWKEVEIKPAQPK